MVNMKGDDVSKSGCMGWLLACVLALAPSISGAVGLGKLTVRSFLGQTLDAEIDLVSVQEKDLTNLTANLASRDAYGHAALQYSGVVSSLRLQIERRLDGRHYIKITSGRTVDDPFVDLLVELNWPTGRLVREYSALIDPGNYASIVTVQSPATVASAATVPVQPIPESSAVKIPTPQPAAVNVEYGPVKRGETLSRIALRLKPDGVSLHQMMVGILNRNPDAFIDNNMNRMKAGQVLRIPDSALLMSLTASEASREVRLQTVGRSRPRALNVDAVTMKAVTAKHRKDKSPQKAIVEKSVLRLSSGDALWNRRQAPSGP